MMKESNYGRGSAAENRQNGDGDNLIAVIDHFIYGDEFWTGSVDDARAFLGAYGDGCVFCRVRIFTLH